MLKKILKTIIYTLLIFLQIACKKERLTGKGVEENKTTIDTVSIEEEISDLPEEIIKYDTIQEFILKANNSFLKLKEPSSGYMTFILLNEDGTLWKKIALHDTYQDNEFQPYSLIPEYNSVKLRIAEKVNDMYKVIVNEEKMIYKYIKVSDKNFIFQDMDHFIMDTAFIEFDDEVNPLYTKADTLSKQVKYDSEANYIPIEVKKEWMKLQNIDNNEFGWIRWKNTNNEVIVSQLR